MVKRKTVGGRIFEAYEAKDYKQKEFASLVSAEIQTLFPDKVGGTNISDKTVRDWINGTTSLKDFQIVAISKVLGVSCDWILTGNEHEDQNIVDDLHLSQNTLTYLRKDYRQNPIKAYFADLTGETWADTVNFYFDNSDVYMFGLLLSVKGFIQRDIEYDLAIDEYFFQGENKGIQLKLTPQELEEAFALRLIREIEEKKKAYQEKLKEQTRKRIRASKTGKEESSSEQEGKR